MNYTCYIIYSKQIDRFYVGETEDPDQRLFLHITGFFKECYTSKATDWVFFHKITCKTREQARVIEHHIKNMKSRVYIENLSKYPELSEKLLQKYK